MVFVTHDQVEAMTMGDRIAVMNDGRLEQVGTPDEIYNSPATLFVAGFIGSPPMNLVATRDIADLLHSGTDDWRNLTSIENGDAVTLGVRPQHLRISPEPNRGLPVTVFALEHLGRESVLILEDEQRSKLRALVEPSFKAKVGDRLFASPDRAHCLLFDAAGGALPKPDSRGG
jgi:ABC-type sugar transport system ATPase subunit